MLNAADVPAARRRSFTSHFVRYTPPLPVPTAPNGDPAAAACAARGAVIDVYARPATRLTTTAAEAGSGETTSSHNDCASAISADARSMLMPESLRYVPRSSGVTIGLLIAATARGRLLLGDAVLLHRAD